jgi:multidrug efflux pump subunit AcrA (membrane-fusion protein)
MPAKARELRTALHRPSVPTAILLVLCGIAVGVAVGVIGPASAEQAPAATAPAGRGTVQKTVTGSGSLAASSTANLNFQTSGTISRVYVHAGEQVKKGQLLATLDDTDARASVSEAQANLDSAQASLHSAKVGSTSTTQSTSSSPTTGTAAASGTASSGSSESPAAKSANIASAEASLESAQVALDNAESTLAQTKLRATMDGLVASVSGEAGQAVTAGTNLDTSSSSSGSSGTSGGSSGGSSGSSTGAAGGVSGGSSTSSSSGSTSSSSSSSSSAVVVLENLDQMKLSVDFSEADIADIRVGKPASVTVSALGNRQFAAKVTEIGLVSSTSNSVVSYPVTLVLTQDSSQLKPGMTGSAKVVVAQADGVIAVPSSSITGSSVQVEQGGKTVTKQVTTGLVGDSTTEITSGLTLGDRVVIQTQSAAGGAGGASGGLPAGGPPGGLSGGIGGGGGPPGGFPGG